MSCTNGHNTQLPQPRSSGAAPTILSSHDYDGFIRKFLRHNLSDPTTISGSTDSSPTTTISTVDDSSATEHSPGSSPESPPPTTFTGDMLRPRTAVERSTPFFELQKLPPPRKGRNLKNLAVVTSRNPARPASSNSLPLEAEPGAPSAVLSPSFLKPPTPPRRKPSNLGLTLLTPGTGKPGSQITMPATPRFARPGTLRHFQSSPSLLLVPGIALSHGKEVDLHKQRTPDTILSPVEMPSNSPPIAEVKEEGEEEEEEQNFDVPLSREEQPQAYPDGPICVYDPCIDLYLEPTAEQARQYDVVMNVASEVRNPLLRNSSSTIRSEPELRIDGGGGIQFKPRKDRDHLVVRKPDQSEQSNWDASPITAKAPSRNTMFFQADNASQEPEYVHIKWEHNSDIVPDLLPLCKLIDERVAQGKRILVHCQCGVSRSASLVVAYGLYKNPARSVQEAYDAVKRRSKWIGPNMNLIMQLQEFRSSLARGGLLKSRSTIGPSTPGSAISEWNGPHSSLSSASQTEPLSAFDPPLENRSALGVISPGPSSAPSGFAWPTTKTTTAARKGQPACAARPSGTFVDPSGHVVPILQLLNAGAVETIPENEIEESVLPVSMLRTTLEPPSSPLSAEFAMAPIRPSEQVNPADNFGILSPSSTEITGNLFDRSALLASLGMGAISVQEETPRRSISLRNRQQHQLQSSLQPSGRLRGKISSPSLREQQQLLELQAKIEANLHLRENRPTKRSTPYFSDDLLSPRATEFTQNPFALALSLPQFSTSEENESLRSTSEDPRSPAQKGASPFTRNIFDVL